MRAEEMVEWAALAEMHRSLRDPGSTVWREACTALGARAFSSPEAREELLRMLQCPCRELRLRGAVALAGLAPLDAEGARELAQQYLLDETTWQDPLLADALFALLPDLPAQFSQDLLSIALAPENVVARASMAASLGGCWKWPEHLPETLANDPSPHVRASLVLSLPSLRGHPSAENARHLLETSDEEWLRTFVEDEFEPPPMAGPDPETQAPEDAPALESEADDVAHAEPMPPDPSPDPTDAEADASPPSPSEEPGPAHEDENAEQEPPEDEEPPVEDPLAVETEALVQQALASLESRDCPMHLTVRVEAFLDAHPELVIETLRPLVSSPGALSLLDGLAYLARSLEVGQTCRVLHRMLVPSREHADRRLQDLAAVLHAQHGERADLVRERTAATREALCLRGPRDMLAWLARREAGGDRMWAPLGEALQGLECGTGMVALQEALAQFEQGIHPATDDNARLWDVLFGMVVEAWTEILDQEIQNQVSGAG